MAILKPFLAEVAIVINYVAFSSLLNLQGLKKESKFYLRSKNFSFEDQFLICKIRNLLLAQKFFNKNFSLESKFQFSNLNFCLIICILVFGFEFQFSKVYFSLRIRNLFLEALNFPMGTNYLHSVLSCKFGGRSPTITGYTTWALFPQYR